MQLRYDSPGAGPSLAGGLLLITLLAGMTVMSEAQTTRGFRDDPSAESAIGPASSHPTSSKHLEQATFGLGCFWCAEAVFERLDGVEQVVSGYSGGQVPKPTYNQVGTGMTGHAEAVQITYDPAKISYADLLEVFWKMHDPTTLDRQGPDIGTQYRSVILYHNDEQRKLAEASMVKYEAEGTFRAPIVTQIVPFRQFFPAEDYHQDYFRHHARQPYCQFVIQPKIHKLETVFREKLKGGKAGSNAVEPGGKDRPNR